LQKLDSERRIAEQEQGRAVDRLVRAGPELLVIDLIEEADALCGNIAFQPDDRFIEAIVAALLDDASAGAAATGTAD
jgi:hypothetical protein